MGQYKEGLNIEVCQRCPERSFTESAATGSREGCICQPGTRPSEEGSSCRGTWILTSRQTQALQLSHFGLVTTFGMTTPSHYLNRGWLIITYPDNISSSMEMWLLFSCTKCFLLPCTMGIVSNFSTPKVLCGNNYMYPCTMGIVWNFSTPKVLCGNNNLSMH